MQKCYQLKPLVTSSIGSLLSVSQGGVVREVRPGCCTVPVRQYVSSVWAVIGVHNVAHCGQFKVIILKKGKNLHSPNLYYSSPLLLLYEHFRDDILNITEMLAAFKRTNERVPGSEQPQMFSRLQ